MCLEPSKLGHWCLPHGWTARVIQTQGCSSPRNVLDLCSQGSQLPGSQTGRVPESSGVECVSAPSPLARPSSSVIS